MHSRIARAATLVVVLGVVTQVLSGQASRRPPRGALDIFPSTRIVRPQPGKSGAGNAPGVLSPALAPRCTVRKGVVGLWLNKEDGAAECH